MHYNCNQIRIKWEDKSKLNPKEKNIEFYNLNLVILFSGKLFEEEKIYADYVEM